MFELNLSKKYIKDLKLQKKPYSDKKGPKKVKNVKFGRVIWNVIILLSPIDDL